MMASQYITRNERRLLLLTVFATIILAISSFAYRCIEVYNQNVAEIQRDLKIEADYIKSDKLRFGIYVLERSPVAPFLILAEILLAILILLSVHKAKKFLMSSCFTAVAFFIFVYWLVGTRYVLSSKEFLNVQVPNRLLLDSNTFDLFLLAFVSILFFWQISILLRMLIKTLQRKTELP